MRHHDFGQGRHLLRLDPGDEIVASLKAFAAEAGVRAGFVWGLGSVDVLVLGFLDSEAQEYVRRRFEERMEVASLTGTLSMEGDRPYVHLHAVVSPRELISYGGHVHEAKVAVLLEVHVQAFPGRLDRVRVGEEAFPRLLLPGEPPPAPGAPER